jgi:hypothetical protein
MVNPQPFFTSCVYDVCACGKEESCLCELLESYVLECGRNGVRLEWRSKGLCGKFLGVLDKKIMIQKTAYIFAFVDANLIKIRQELTSR